MGNFGFWSTNKNKIIPSEGASIYGAQFTEPN